MEEAILWTLLTIGIVLFLFSLRKPPIKDWIVIFLLTAYIATFLGVIAVEENMLDYPVQLLDTHFDSSILFEYLLLPIVCIYFYQTTYHSSYRGIVLQCVLYASSLTIVEFFLEQNTDLIEYHTWTWMHTFVSVFLLMLFVRLLADLLNRKHRK